MLRRAKLPNYDYDDDVLVEDVLVEDAPESRDEIEAANRQWRAEQRRRRQEEVTVERAVRLAQEPANAVLLANKDYHALGRCLTVVARKPATESTEYILCTGKAQMPASCRGWYGKVAIVEVMAGSTPLQLAERDRAVVSILRHSAALNVGSSARSAFARRLADYEEKFAALRKKRARRAA